jgi:hypothetical protein
MAKYISNRQRNLKIGIVSYTENNTVLEVTGKVGIGTTNATSKLHVNGDVRVSGVVTATTFVGALTGTATTAGISTHLKGGLAGNVVYQSATDATAFLTNGDSGKILQSNGVGNAPTWVPAAPSGAVSGLVVRDSNNTIVGTSGSISQLTFGTGLSVTGAAGAAGIATITLSSNIVGTSLSITGISTFTNGPILVGTGTATGTASQPLQVTGGAYVSGSVGIGTTNPTSKLHVIGDVIVTGIVTASRFVSNVLTGTAPISVASSTRVDNLNAQYVGGFAAPISQVIGSSDTQTLTNKTIELGSNTITGTLAEFNTALTDANFVSIGGTETLTNKTLTSPILTTPSLGIATATSINVSGVVTASQLSTGVSGTGININTSTISGPATLTIDPAAVGDNTGAVRIKGDLYVDGTQFIVNSTTIELADFNVGIATTVGTDALLDGAGIGIGSTGIRKTLTWNDTSDSLKSSENFDVASGKTYKVDGTSVLSNNTLGSGVTNSSLTSVGTLGQLNVSGIATLTQISAGGTVGTAGSVLSSTGSGLSWIPAASNEGGGVSISTNTTNQSQFLTYVTGTGTTTGFGVTTTSLVFNPSTKRLGIGTDTLTTTLNIDGALGFTNNNIRIGDANTGCSITSGTHNFFAGSDAGRYNTTGSCNNFFGSCAGRSNTSGSCNNFLGFYAGRCNTSGSCNNFLGSYAGYCNTTGFANNFFGSCAGRINTTGCYNNFLGYRAGGCNTTGGNNNFFGYQAGRFNNTGKYNNFFGNSAGYANTTGCYNNFFGNNAGCANTTGSQNNFLGNGAGRFNTTGSGNNFLGRDAGNSNDTGCNNNFLGNNAGSSNGAGSHNNFFGAYSGRCNTTGCYNNFFGNNAGRFNITGCNNNFFGNSAACTQTAGNRNIALGFNVQLPNITGSDQLNIGSNGNSWISGNSSFNVGIGTTNPTSKLHVIGDVRVGINTSQGVILSSANGTKYRLLVSDGGVLSTSVVT